MVERNVDLDYRDVKGIAQVRWYHEQGIRKILKKLTPIFILGAIMLILAFINNSYTNIAAWIVFFPLLGSATYIIYKINKGQKNLAKQLAKEWDIPEEDL